VHFCDGCIHFDGVASRLACWSPLGVADNAVLKMQVELQPSNQLAIPCLVRFETQGTSSSTLCRRLRLLCRRNGISSDAEFVEQRSADRLLCAAARNGADSFPVCSAAWPMPRRAFYFRLSACDVTDSVSPCQTARMFSRSKADVALRRV